MGEVARRLAGVNQEIWAACRASGRDPGEVRLVAVSKFQPERAIREAALAGQTAFGENYVQEANAKQTAFSDFEKQLEWHMIGHVQSRKARDVAGRYALIHSLDSTRLADALERHLEAASQKVLIEVNIGEESQKTGIMPQEAGSLARHVLEKCPHLALNGLMCMAPVYDAGEQARPYFRALRELRDRLEREIGHELPELSMGMSGDFCAAIAEGATIVRIGTGIFGPRPAR